MIGRSSRCISLYCQSLYKECTFNPGNLHCTKRAYSDFLKNLPRVGGGISKFKKEVPPQQRSKPLTPVAQNVQLSPKMQNNRFAQQFAKPESNSPGKRPFQDRRQQQQTQDKNRSNTNNVTSQNPRANKNAEPRPSSNNIAKSRTSQNAESRPFTNNRPNHSTKSNTKSFKPPINHRKDKKVRLEKIQIQIPTFITVSNLASILRIPLNEFIKKLESLGFEEMTHNYILDKENASLIADEFGFEITMNDDAGLDLFPAPEDSSKLKPRPPVVTIMGHVDHGKTTILDYLRKSSIVNQEHGGITQHIGAFSVTTPISKKNITFLDTPGHAAFLKMRERGAIITDIVILVVAADDSVMPQTLEAIKHAKKSGVPIIVAINKCDKQGVNVDKVLSDLARYEIDIEDYGGETQTVRVSGKTGMNMDKLEEAVITLSELSEFQAEPQGIPAEGWVIESQVEKGMGNISTILVRRGTIKVGSFLVAGKTYCKVRGMKDENGKMVKTAGPSTPVRIWGWKDLPEAGDQILEAKNEKVAKKVIENRITREKQIQAGQDIEIINAKRQEEIKELQRQEKLNELKLAGINVEELPTESTETKCTQVKYIIKSDVFGSAEAIKESVDGLGNDEVKALVISHGAGLPTDSDIDTAKALDAKIVCFNIKTPKQISFKAERLGVSIAEHNIIYRLIEEITEELTSKLKPHIEIKTVAEIDIKGVFVIMGKNKSKSKIAGCKVSNGNLKRSSNVRVIRNDEVIYTGTLSSLKHAKDDINEAKKGTECGLAFERWDKFEEGDKIEVFEEVKHQRYL